MNLRDWPEFEMNDEGEEGVERRVGEYREVPLMYLGNEKLVSGERY